MNDVLSIMKCAVLSESLLTSNIKKKNPKCIKLQTEIYIKLMLEFIRANNVCGSAHFYSHSGQ